jgi:hypothetical protein
VGTPMLKKPHISKVQVSSQKISGLKKTILSYFNNQIWQNQLMDDPHLDYIPKICEKKKD